jgi:hypothetical protein
MHKYLAIFLFLFVSGSVISQEENVPEFSDEDFINYIHESLVASIFEDWEVAYMEGQVGKTESGEIDAQAAYFYSTRSNYGDVRLFLSNTTALLNAIALININAQARGETWTSFKLEFFPDKTHRLTTW